MPENLKEKPIFGEKEKVVEKEVMVDVGKEAPVPREIEGWLEKHEKSGQGVVKLGEDTTSAGSAQDIKIVLPGSRKNFTEGLKKPVSEAGRWLSTFIEKLIKINQGKVKFKEE